MIKDYKICNLEQLERLEKNVPAKADELICDMLLDERVNTTDMFVSLVHEYIGGNDEFRQGMDAALNILLWKDMQEIADAVEQQAEGDKEE